mgnify:CR=1 FL=1
MEMYYDKLYYKHRPARNLVLDNGHVFIQSYEDDTHDIVAGLAQQLGERRGFAGEPFGRLSPTLRSLRCHMVIVERVEPDRTGVLDPNACSC